VPLSALNCEVQLTDTKTRVTRNLTPGTVNSWGAVWSPDGKHLAFYSDEGGSAAAWVWESEDGNVRRVSAETVHPRSTIDEIRWMPDSRSLVIKVVRTGTIFSHAEAGTKPGTTLLDGPISSKMPTVTVYGFNPATVGNEDLIESLDLTREPFAADLALIDIQSGSTIDVVRDVWPTNDWISPDGKYLAYVNVKKPRSFSSTEIHYELVLHSFVVHTDRILVPDFEQDSGTSVSWSPDSRTLAFISDGQPDASRRNAGLRGDCFVVHLNGDKPRNLTQGSHPPFGGVFFTPLWNSKSDTVYLMISSRTQDVESVPLGSDAIWKASLIDGKVSEVARIPGHNVIGFVSASDGLATWFPEDRESLIVGTQDQATREAGFWKIRLASGNIQKLFEGRVAFSFPSPLSTDVSRDGHTIAYSAQDSQHPPDIWLTGSNFGDLRRVTNINPQLEGMVFGTSEPISYTDLDGVPLHGALLLPSHYQRDKRYPLIVWLYSGTFMSRNIYQFGLDSSVFASLNLQMLATRGYAVLVPDVPTQVGTPMLDILKSVLPAVDCVVEMGVADPNRLGVMGHSYGGYSTLSLIEQTTRFKAAVNYSGTADLVLHYAAMQNDGTSPAMEWAENGQGRMGGTLWQHPNRYINNSPIFYLDRIRTPVLIIHGEADDTVQVQEANEVFVGLRRLNREVVYARYGGEPHEIMMPMNVNDYWNRVTAWFDEHLRK
jgi:dipeptidyl aminopeptidase/acylaminoacyl peptidase